MDKLDTWLDHLVYALDRLGALPAAALVFLACLALGYVIRSIRWLDNSRIPGVCICAGGILKLLSAEWPDGPNWRVWMMREVLFGLIIGWLAWEFHDKILAQCENAIVLKFKQMLGKLGLLNGNAASPPANNNPPQKDKPTP